MTTRYGGDDEATLSVDYDGGLQAAADDGRVDSRLGQRQTGRRNKHRRPMDRQRESQRIGLDRSQVSAKVAGLPRFWRQVRR